MSQTVTVAVAAVTAGTDFTFEICVVPTDIEEFTLGKITLVSPTTIAAQGGTNFNTLTIAQYRAAASVATLATNNFGTTGLTADTPLNLTVAKELQGTLQAGDLIRGAYTHTGTGATQIAVQLDVELL